jgi:hypothetical protein
LVEAEAVYEGEVLMNGTNALKKEFWECAGCLFWFLDVYING